MILHIGEAKTAKQMNTDPYCQQQNCSQLKVFFSDVQIVLMLLGVRLLGGLQLEYSGRRWRFSTSTRENWLSHRR